MPKTKTGKWSIWLIFLFLIFFALFSLAATLSGILGVSGGDKPTDNLFLFIPILLAGLTGSASFFSSVVSIIFFKERKPLIWVPVLVGGFILLFTVGELIGH